MYVPVLLTEIDVAVPPVLHNNVPNADVDNVEVPSQLFTTFTEGAVGVVFGAAVPDPEALVQPSTVCVTVYVPALPTVIDEAVSVVLHNKLPEVVADNVEVPLQLLVTFTVGANGVVFGAAVPDPSALVQPSTV